MAVNIGSQNIEYDGRLTQIANQILRRNKSHNDSSQANCLNAFEERLESVHGRIGKAKFTI